MNSIFNYRKAQWMWFSILKFLKRTYKIKYRLSNIIYILYLIYNMNLLILVVGVGPYKHFIPSYHMSL